MLLPSEKTAKRKRMLVTNEDGSTKVVRKRDPRGFCCSKCGAKDSTRWRRFDDNSVHCKFISKMRIQISANMLWLQVKNVFVAADN